MKIGDMVKIRECDSLPELVGENAEIVDMQIQRLEKYTVYPLWVKMTSGERTGKIYGFREGEVEILPKADETQDTSNERREKTMKTKVVEQVEEILKGVTTVEDIVEVERVINEVKGRILAEPALGFWEGKTPCWEMFRCPEGIKIECPAFKYRSLPCWEIEGTYSKLYDYGAKGDSTDICQVCRVYKRWGHGEPIQIKLFGKGFNHIGKVKVEAKHKRIVTVTPTTSGEERLKGREAILAVLIRAAEQDGFLEQLINNPDEALKGYCVLTNEELDALVNADIQKIEGWLNRLDTRKVATWLNRLNQKLDPQLAAWLWRK